MLERSAPDETEDSFMRLNRTAPIACLILASLACACSKKLTAEAIEKSPDAVVQKGNLGTSTWLVAPDGTVNGTLKGPDGKPITQTVTGQVTFVTPGGAPASVPVQYDPQSGVLNATGPKLTADITPVSYALTVDGKPWGGSIDVPNGGTHELVASASMEPPLPPGTVGPNGGVVQMVGPDRVELVASKSTGDVRAYVLDADNRPIDPGDRKITVALQGEEPEVVVLEPEPEGHFVIGHLRTRVDPAHVTVAVNVHGRTHACLVGWSPGAVVLVGPQAPRVHLLAVDAWPGEVIDVHGRHGHFHGDVVVGGGPEVVVGAPGVVVGAPGVVVGAPPILAPPGVVVGAPGVAVGAPGVVVGARGGFGGPPAVGGRVVVHEVGHGGGHHGR
jgi:hypothetical protein